MLFVVCFYHPLHDIPRGLLYSVYHETTDVAEVRP